MSLFDLTLAFSIYLALLGISVSFFGGAEDDTRVLLAASGIAAIKTRAQDFGASTHGYTNGAVINNAADAIAEGLIPEEWIGQGGTIRGPWGNSILIQADQDTLSITVENVPGSSACSGLASKLALSSARVAINGVLISDTTTGTQVDLSALASMCQASTINNLRVDYL